jgi:hypothetical protein
MNLLASVANKRLTPNITPLDATLTKNTGRGVSTLNVPTVQHANLFWG